MKTKEIVFVVEEDPEQGYSAKALGYSIFTEGDSLTELKDNIKDAIKCHFDKDDMPLYVRLHIITEEKFACA
jgi:predicted RNase H-like HicB family nuclease